MRPTGQESCPSRAQLFPWYLEQSGHIRVKIQGSVGVCFSNRDPWGTGLSGERVIKSPGQSVGSDSHTPLDDLTHRFLIAPLPPVSLMWGHVRGNRGWYPIGLQDSLLNDPQRTPFPIGKNPCHVSQFP